MELVKLDKVERNKIWEAMIEAGVIIEKPKCKKLKTAQYDLHKRLNNTNTIQSIQLMRTILFFYDKYHGVRKIFQDKLHKKEKVVIELKDEIERLQRQNASLQNEVKSLKQTLLEETEEKEFYKRFKLDNVKNNNIEVKPDVVAEKIDCYGMSACVVTTESVSSDDEINYDE